IHKFKTENGIEYESSEITVGCGAKHVLFNAFISTIDDGDEVIIPAPYWVSYPDMVELFGGKAVVVKTKFENNFKITAEELEKAITQKTKWIVLNSPSNPTGEVYTKEELFAIGNVIEKHSHVYVMSDDIYEHLVFGVKFYTLAQLFPNLQNRILTINGVSKSYAMTGWRIGFAGIKDKALIKAIGNVQSQSTTNPSSISQEAARLALLEAGNFRKETVPVFAKRRDYVFDRLTKINGIKAKKPDGAFYIFFSVEDIIGKKTESGKVLNSSEVITEYLLEDAEVACVHGEAFGFAGFIRISYATSEAILEDAMNRIERSLNKLK
ncbi:MAG: pyridoxal phosphate-dependent aminotransferase, partial [Proteobacteria bacterium]|nr:pyridoxal phosphate-dependent aminotransferase [Pseudomonadota bacterium]